MAMKGVGVMLLVTVLFGCGTEPLTYESLSGTYSGSFVSTEPGGDQFDGNMELVVSQSDEMLTGSWEIDGTISGRGTVSTTTDGPWTGTLPLGSNPSFDIEVAYSFCPDDPWTYRLSFDSGAGTLSLTGDLEILSSACDLLTSYPLSLSLSR